MSEKNEKQEKLIESFTNYDSNIIIGEKKFEDLEERIGDITLYKINEVTYEENDKSPRRESFENILGALNIDGINFVYIIIGNKQGISFYFGVVKDLKEDIELDMTIKEIGEKFLKSGIQGNFRGSKISRLTPCENLEILSKIKDSKRFGMIEGIPVINETSDKNSYQGVDRLVDVMLGDEFGLCILAKPMKNLDIRTIEKQLYTIYDKLSILSKRNIQSGVNDSSSTGKTTGKNETESLGESKTESKSEGKTISISVGTNESTSISSGKNTSKTEGKNEGKNEGSTESSSSTKGITYGSSTGSSLSETKGETKSNSTTNGKNEGKSSGESSNITEGTSTTKTKTAGTNESENTNVTKGTSFSVSTEIQNREIVGILKYIDEVILSIIDYGKSKGMYLTNSFIFSNDKGTLLKLGNTMKSLFSGKQGNKMPLKLEILDEDDKRIEYFHNLQLPNQNISEYNKNEKDTLLLRARLNDKNIIDYGNWYSANELSLIAGLPKKEVVGLSLKEEVEFGLNVTTNNNEEKIDLGKLVQSGNELEIDVSLEKNALNKHIFITGVTGTGKTTTCQKLLLESNMPFLVVEPAKTEYRVLFDKEETKDILIFTLGKDTVSPFRLNPFEFFEHESITSRVDMLKASMEASFDMEAAIPQLIESAMYECYKDYGWDILTNKNKKFKNPFAEGVYSFPTLGDLLKKVEEEVEKQGFDDRLKKDYIGSIKARLQGLLIGSKGIMLNVGRGIDFRELIEKKVVLEIEEIKNGSEKSLIMGFILTNLCEALKAKYRENRQFKHITLIEEAHRLLAKYTPGDNPNKKQGIETFTDMLAEVRKYGESLIIADQIPNKLTPEVLKNTNTKIVHKLFATDDKEAIGATMSLSEEQKRFLSSLTTGRAIVFSQGWDKALQVQIKQSTNTTGERYVEDYELRDRAMEFYRKKEIIIGLKYIEGKIKEDQFDYCKQISSDQDNIKIFKEMFEEKIKSFDEFKKIFDVVSDEELWNEIKKYLRSEKKNIKILEKIKKVEKIETVLNKEEFESIFMIKCFDIKKLKKELKQDVYQDISIISENILTKLIIEIYDGIVSTERIRRNLK